MQKVCRMRWCKWIAEFYIRQLIICTFKVIHKRISLQIEAALLITKMSTTYNSNKIGSKCIKCWERVQDLLLDNKSTVVTSQIMFYRQNSAAKSPQEIQLTVPCRHNIMLSITSGKTVQTIEQASRDGPLQMDSSSVINNSIFKLCSLESLMGRIEY